MAGSGKKVKRALLSSRFLLMALFLVLTLIAFSVISGIVFSQWRASTNQVILAAEEDINREVRDQLDAFFRIPMAAGTTTRHLIEQGVLEMTDVVRRDTFFVSVLFSLPDTVYSFSYGTSDGHYYGARRSETAVEIMINNATTGGSSWYYAVTDELKAGERMVVAGVFDPRTRAWYQAAAEKGSPVFSPIYKHFIMDDLTVSAALPVYDPGRTLWGVVGAHINLTQINSFLENIVAERHAAVYIVERETGYLVASSTGLKPFRHTGDQTAERLQVQELEQTGIAAAYQAYLESGLPRLDIYHDEDLSHIMVDTYQQDGLDWLVVTSLATGHYLSPILAQIRLAAALTALAILVFILINLKATSYLLRPLTHLVDVSRRIAGGDLTARASVGRQDEFADLADAFNQMADAATHQIRQLNEAVAQRTQALQTLNQDLQDNKDQLQLLLDSTAEAIYGMDKSGTCTFCNVSCVKMLGYSEQADLLGQNMHEQIHSRRANGEPMSLTECRIYQTFQTGQGIQADNEVFWKKDGTSIPVEYFAYPQYKEGQLVGVVVTFMDIGERKKAREAIEHLSFHDALTGLYNRAFFEAELSRLDTARNLPISIIAGDVNSLKLTNDVFGHAAGDRLLRTVADVLRQVCRADDIIARTGGDEFVLLLPRTGADDAETLLNRIRREFEQRQIEAITVSVSLGSSSKTDLNQNLVRVLEEAEDKMYEDKTLNRNNVRGSNIQAIVSYLHDKDPAEEAHARRVSTLGRRIAAAMKLKDEAIRRVGEAGYFHDIGKVTLAQSAQHNEINGEKADKDLLQHPVIGFRILNAFDDTVDLADLVLTHHENWDGTGYPKGLKGADIPELARIIAVAETYDTLLHLQNNRLTAEQAAARIQSLAGSKLDPDVVAAYLSMLQSSDGSPVS